MIRHELKRQGMDAVEYDGETQLLRIQFARGAVYEYEQVPQAVVDWLLRTKDPAGYLKRIITPGFVYYRVTDAGARRSGAGGSSARPGTADESLEAQLRASIDKLGGPVS